MEYDTPLTYSYTETSAGDFFEGLYRLPANETTVHAVGNVSLNGALRDLELPARLASEAANMVQKNRRVQSVQAHLRATALQGFSTHE